MLLTFNIEQQQWLVTLFALLPFLHMQISLALPISNNLPISQRLIHEVAHQLVAKNMCPQGWKDSMCTNPPAFYIWLRQLKDKELKEQLRKGKYFFFKQIISINYLL